MEKMLLQALCGSDITCRISIRPKPLAVLYKMPSPMPSLGEGGGDTVWLQILRACIAIHNEQWLSVHTTFHLPCTGGCVPEAPTATTDVLQGTGKSCGRNEAVNGH